MVKKLLVAVLLTLVAAAVGAQAVRPTPGEELEVLLDRIADPATEEPDAIETRIMELWAISGSDTADFLLQRGQAALNAEDYPTAVAHLSALIDHAPEFAEAWNARATAYFLMEEYALSVADIEVALALNPRHFGALAGLGIILEQSGRDAQALSAFRAAQVLNPHREQVNDAVTRLSPRVDGTAL